jgi:hypothetical protein
LVARGLFRGRVFMGGWGQRGPGPTTGRPDRHHERDVDVVDVTPLEVTHTKKPSS